MATPPTETEIPLGFGGSTAAVGDHIAHFYRGEAEMFSVPGPYIAAGLERDERCAVICSPDSAVNFRAWLDARGLDAAAAEGSGRLFLHPGEASSDDMRTLFDRVVADSEDAGYPFVRLAGDGGWALAGRATAAEMLRWEALYDEVSDGWPILALCQFDLTRFGGDVVMDAIRSHPLCIMGEVLVHNAMHTDPTELLEELAERI